MPPRISSFFALGVLIAVTGCSQQAAAPASPPPPEVGVIVMQPQTVELTRDPVGRLAPFRSADVRARVAGVLLERVYVEGKDVNEGDVLFRIDPAPLRATLAQAQATLAQAQASYTNARIAARRGHELAPKNYISKSDLDNLEATERSAAAAVQAARAAVDGARIDLDYATVRAPISGRASKQQVTEGALVGQGAATLLTTIDQIDPLYVNFSMSVNELEQLRRAQDTGAVRLAGTGQAAAQVVLADGSVYAHEGVVDFSDTTVDPATGAVSLRARIPNPDQRLLPGTFVTLKVRLGERDDVFVVPQAAVLRDPVGAYVLVLGPDDKVVRKTIASDSSRDGQWLVTGGLSAGDRVIVSGVQKVAEGSSAVAAAPAADSAAPSTESVQD